MRPRPPGTSYKTKSRLDAKHNWSGLKTGVRVKTRHPTRPAIELASAVALLACTVNFVLLLGGQKDVHTR